MSKKCIVICTYCNNELERYRSQLNSKLYFCNVNCKANFTKGKTLTELHGKEKAEELIDKLKQQTGDKNPNYNKRWSLEKRENYSKNKIEYFKNNPEARFLSGTANRGKKLTKEIVFKMHSNRTKESYSRLHTLQSKELISQKSKIKFTEEYKKKHRKIMEERGHWIPLANKPLLDLYQKESNWVVSMYDYVIVDNTIKDKVRDHIIPRWVGFKFNINPIIIRHPLNCQVISRSYNITKGFKDRKIDDLIWQQSLYKLINDIIDYKSDWIEQDAACYAAINYKTKLLEDNIL